MQQRALYHGASAPHCCRRASDDIYAACRVAVRRLVQERVAAAWPQGAPVTSDTMSTPCNARQQAAPDVLRVATTHTHACACARRLTHRRSVVCCVAHFVGCAQRRRQVAITLTFMPLEASVYVGSLLCIASDGSTKVNRSLSAVQRTNVQRTTCSRQHATRR